MSKIYFLERNDDQKNKNDDFSDWSDCQFNKVKLCEIASCIWNKFYQMLTYYSEYNFTSKNVFLFVFFQKKKIEI